MPANPVATKRITIRGVDVEVFTEDQTIIADNPGLTMGMFISEALEDYIAVLPEFEDENSET